MKICTKCNQTKPLDQFHANKAAPDGKRPDCKDCWNARVRSYKSSNKKKIKESWVQYYTKNKDRELERGAQWRKDNREKCAEYTRKWQKSNRHRRREIDAKRKAAELRACPVWLSEEQKQQIQDIYWLARDLEITSGGFYEVDHVVPLQGKNVCGLHVPWNLQILPRSLNRSKGNKHD